MYIDPFIFGVLVTVGCEVAAVFVIAVINYYRRRK